MRTTPTTSPGLRPICWACALILGVATSAVVAQDHPDHGIVDKFVTTQEGASGLGRSAVRSEDARRRGAADRAFLVQAHQIELLLLHAGAVAQQRNTTQAVKSHARRVIQSHQASLVAIEKIGRDHGVELERRFTVAFERRARTLQQTKDSSFAPVFFGQMLELHGHTVALYEQASATLDSGELLSLVKDSLPTLRTQLADAEQFSTDPGTIAAR